MLDVLKEYLIDIGFNVDSQSLNKARSSMAEAENAMNKFATSTGSKLAGAGAAVVTFIATMDMAIASMVSGLAKTDMEMQIFARLMWTSKENAMAFKTTLDAMGVSMQDLYVNPELMNKFLELRNQGLTMGPPAAEYEKQMKSIREFQYEFAKLKISATYALQWIGFYIGKYLSKPMEELKQWFKEVNDKLISTMPKWTEKVAQFASWFIRLGEVLIKLPDAVKLLVLALASWKTVASLVMNPLTWIIAGFTALLLLMDDYNTYKSGGDSLFSDVWKAFDDDSVKKSMDEISKSLNEIFDSLMKIFNSVDWKSTITDGLLIALQALERSLKFISEYLKAISDLMKGDLKNTMFGVANAGRALFGAEPLNPDDYTMKTGDQLKTEAENWFDSSLAGKLRESTAGFRDWIYGTTANTDYYNKYGRGNTTNNNTFNIQSTDPVAVGNEVDRILRNQRGY